MTHRRSGNRRWWLGAFPLFVFACGGSTSGGPASTEGGTPLDGAWGIEPPTDAALDSGPAPDALDAQSGSADASDGGLPGDASPDASDGGLPGDAQSGSVDASDGGDAAPGCLPGSCIVSFASGPDWLSYAGSVSSTGSTYTLSQLLGPATEVCLNASDPPSCPAGAFLYAYATSGPAWTGGQTISGARWIWRPDVALGSPASMQVAIFEKTFVVGANATGSLRIAADDFAAVFVNDIAIGVVGSTSDVNVAAPAHTSSTTLSLTPALQPGSNRIVIAAQNGPFGCSTSACPYSEDPAGVVFGGTLTY